MSNGWRLFLIAASGIITCILITVGLVMVRQSKEMGNSVISGVAKFNKSVEEQTLTQYDGASVTGSDVANLIRRELGEYADTETAPISISVTTVNATTNFTNSESVSEMQNFSHISFIPPTASFLGAIVRNKNDVIVQIIFVQQ